MKVCPQCNNANDNQASTCLYCGRNLIGVREHNYNLNVQGEVVNEEMSKADIAQRVYGGKTGIVDEYQTEAIKYQALIKKYLEVYFSVMFLLAIVMKLSTYQFLIKDFSVMYPQLFPLGFAILGFLSAYLKVQVKIKMLFVLLLAGASGTLLVMFEPLLPFQSFEDFLSIKNIIPLGVILGVTFIKLKSLKLLVYMASMAVLLFNYYQVLQSLSFSVKETIFALRSPLIFLMHGVLILFLMYEILFHREGK